MINKLVAEIKKKDAPVVVGLDPMLGYVPEHLTKKAFEEFGEQQRQSGSIIRVSWMQFMI